MKILFFIITILAASIFVARSQTIDSLLSEAVANNPQFKSLQQKKQSVDYRSQSTAMLPSPTLSLGFGNVPFGKFNLFGDALSNELSLSQMFPLGGKLGAMADVDKKYIDIYDSDIDILKINLRSQIKEIYYSIWLIDRKIEVEQENIGFLNDLVSSLNSLYLVSKARQADIITTKAEIGTRQVQIVVLTNQRHTEVARLNNLLGRDINSSTIDIVENPEADTTGIDDRSLAEIIDRHPMLARMDRMIEMNNAMEIANNKEKIPDLMLQATLMRMPKGMILTSSSDLGMLDKSVDYGFSLMASITLPFAPYAADKINYKSQEIEASSGSIDYDKQTMRRDLLTRLKESLNKLNTAQRLVNLYRNEIIPAYKSVVESQTSEYQNSKTYITAVIDARRMLTMQEMDYYMAVADCQMAIAEIEMVTGVVIKSK